MKCLAFMVAKGSLKYKAVAAMAKFLKSVDLRFNFSARSMSMEVKIKGEVKGRITMLMKKLSQKAFCEVVDPV